jgi:hypothetical protein
VLDTNSTSWFDAQHSTLMSVSRSHGSRSITVGEQLRKPHRSGTIADQRCLFNIFHLLSELDQMVYTVQFSFANGTGPPKETECSIPCRLIYNYNYSTRSAKTPHHRTFPSSLVPVTTPALLLPSQLGLAEGPLCQAMICIHTCRVTRYPT